MEEKKTNVWKSALNWGLSIGIILVIYSVIMYFLGLSLEKWVGWVSYLIMIAGIIYSTINYRDKELGGYIKYGQALGFGTLVILFAGIISSIYTYFQMTFIDPDMISKILEMTEEQLITQGLPDDQIEMAIEMQKKFMKPGIMVAIAIPSIAFMGFLFSLITSIFLKKEPKDASFSE
ncbi:MAG: DUF4199 domain-containing protein [Bacteroidales bacterium]|nr:DUF4199 domain-containing protein [Bacteroidales bacterium]MBN2758159.1 DUF4199 domain-containing protein [Bacteroidales bacterium]